MNVTIIYYSVNHIAQVSITITIKAAARGRVVNQVLAFIKTCLIKGGNWAFG